MKVNFNLKQMRESESLTQVILVITVQGKRIRVYTRIRVCPSEWDKKSQRCIVSSSVPLRRARELKLFNERLQWIEDQIFHEDYALAMKGLYLTVADVRGVVAKSLNKQMEALTPLAYLKWLVENHNQEVKRSGLKGKESSQTTYRMALNRVENFCQEKGFRLASFDDFDRLFFNSFMDYLYNHQFTRGGKKLRYSSITMSNTIKVLKNLLHQAYLNDVSKNQYYNKVQTNTLDLSTEKIYLAEDEVKRVLQVEPQSQKEREVRDMFVIACYTALRISDLKQLNNAVIGDEIIQLYQVKTQQKVTIPILKEIKELVVHYKKHGFPKLQNTQANRIIKQLAERAGITQEIPIHENRGGHLEVKIMPKFQLISFHTARRSCITNLFMRNYSPNYIMTLSGHRSLQSFQRYIRASQQEVSDAFCEMLRKENAL